MLSPLQVLAALCWGNTELLPHCTQHTERWHRSLGTLGGGLNGGQDGCEAGDSDLLGATVMGPASQLLSARESGLSSDWQDMQDRGTRKRGARLLWLGPRQDTPRDPLDCLRPTAHGDSGESGPWVPQNPHVQQMLGPHLKAAVSQSVGSPSHLRRQRKERMLVMIYLFKERYR